MSGCGALEMIEDGAFVGCEDLEHVEISQNRRLHRVAEDAFGGATPALRQLDLSDNALSTLGAALVNWRGLKGAVLSGNPWRCDCEIGAVAGALAAMGSSNDVLVVAQAARAAECAEPPELRGLPLASLAPAELACSADTNRVRQQLKVEGDGDDDRHSSTSSSSSVLSTLAVILCALAAAALLLCVVVALLAARFGDRARLWAKSLREPRRRGGWRFGGASSPGGSSRGSRGSGGSGGGGSGTASSSVRHYHPAPDLPPPPPPSLPHPEYQRHLNLPQPHFSGSDDEYYYVATWKDREAAGKHIPVTVL